MSESVPLTCHLCQLSLSLSPNKTRDAAYIHIAPMGAHVHAAVIHMRMIHCDCCYVVMIERGSGLRGWDSISNSNLIS